MAYLNKPILWLLFCATIPVIIHLLNRRRHRTVKWAAMAFLLQATRESKGKKKLKHFAILAARTLAVLALVLAIAQPLIGGFLGGGSKIDAVILVLDRSLTMETVTGVDGESKRQQAIIEIKNTLKKAGNPRLILIDSASSAAQEVEKPELLEILSSTAATDTKAEIPHLIETAVNHIISTNLTNAEIWVASDLQASNWDTMSSKWETIRSGLNELEQQPQLRIMALTAETNQNRSTKIISSRRNGNDLVIDFEIERTSGSEPVAVSAVIYLNGKEYKSVDYSLTGQRAVLQESIDLRNAPLSGYGYISISPDANNRDNNAYFAYGEATPSHTLVVSEGVIDTQFLEVPASIFGHQSAEVIKPNELDSAQLKKTSMVVWQAPLPSDGNATTMLRFIQNGGSVIFLPSTVDSDHEFLGIQWSETQSSARDQYFIISDWNESDGPQRNYSNGASIPLEHIQAIKRRSLSGEITALADWDDNSTAMGRIIEGQGTAYFITTLTDRRWSNLDNGGVTVPIFQNMLDSGNLRFGSSFFSETGRHSPLSKQKADLVTIVDNSAVNERYSIDKDAIHSAPLYLAGVKRIDERIIATNRPNEEGDLAILKDDDLKAVFKGTSYTLFENKDQKNANSTRPIWQFLLVAALIFLLVEAILCLTKKSSVPATNITS